MTSTANRIIGTIAGFAAVSASANAGACLPLLEPRPALAEARSAFDAAAAIVDVQVVGEASKERILLEGLSADFRVLKVWKGKVGGTITIRAWSSCDLHLTERGNKYRLALGYHQGRYHAAYDLNGANTRELDAFEAEMDRIIENQRPSSFTPVPSPFFGEEARTSRAAR